MVEALLDTHRPDAWIGLGVSEAAIIQTEMVGVNWRHFDVPDSSGAHVDLSPIIPGGPVGYNATLPNAEMVAALTAAGIPGLCVLQRRNASVQPDALHHGHVIAERGLPTVTGFIHVPQTPDNIALMPGRKRQSASMSLTMTTDAIAICIETLVKTLTAHHPQIA